MATKRVEYVGVHRPGVIVRLADGSNREVAFGEPVELDSETASGLLAGGEFREPKSGPKPKQHEEDGA